MIDSVHRNYYAVAVTAKSVAGFSSPSSKRRISAHILTAGAFFISADSSYGGCAWDALGRAGFLFDRSANLRTVATFYCLAAICGGSIKQKGALLMAIHTQNLPVRQVRHQFCISLLKQTLRRCNDIQAIAVQSSLESLCLMAFQEIPPEYPGPENLHALLRIFPGLNSYIADGLCQEPDGRSVHNSVMFIKGFIAALSDTGFINPNAAEQIGREIHKKLLQRECVSHE